MTRREEANKLRNLADSVEAGKDLRQMPEEILIEDGHYAGSSREIAREHQDRVMAELRRRGWSWPRLVKEFEIPQTSLVRRVRKHLPKEQDPNS